MLRRLLKLAHVIGAIGVMGGFAACLLLIATAPTEPAPYAAVRHGIAELVRWLVVPSLALVIVSGLLSIAFHEAYKSAGWAWIKALLGISMFEGTLLTVASSARSAAELSAQAVTGAGNSEALAQVVRTEWGGLWLLLAVALVNVVLAIWRPRIVRHG